MVVGLPRHERKKLAKVVRMFGTVLYNEERKVPKLRFTIGRWLVARLPGVEDMLFLIIHVHRC